MFSAAHLRIRSHNVTVFSHERFWRTDRQYWLGAAAAVAQLVDFPEPQTLTDGLIIRCWQVRVRWLAVIEMPPSSRVTINHWQNNNNVVHCACVWQCVFPFPLCPDCDPGTEESWRQLTEVSVNESTRLSRSVCSTAVAHFEFSSSSVYTTTNSRQQPPE